MCTVTFLPLDQHKFILTSNRDESPGRKVAFSPDQYFHNGIKIIYPKDSQANGTWIATSDNGYTLCLLNGAFEFHHHSPPYKKSRGLMLLDFFNYGDIKRFTDEYDFSGIEPFTLIILKHQDIIELKEIRFDEKGELFISTKSPFSCNIWSSATLYSKETIVQREKWFEKWLSDNPKPDIENILQFHHFGGDGDKCNNILMSRGGVKTISITCVTNKDDNIEMIYEDLLQNQTKVFQNERQLNPIKNVS